MADSVRLGVVEGVAAPAVEEEDVVGDAVGEEVTGVETVDEGSATSVRATGVESEPVASVDVAVDVAVDDAVGDADGTAVGEAISEALLLADGLVEAVTVAEGSEPATSSSGSQSSGIAMPGAAESAAAIAGVVASIDTRSAAEAVATRARRRRIMRAVDLMAAPGMSLTLTMPTRATESTSGPEVPHGLGQYPTDQADETTFLGAESRRPGGEDGAPAPACRGAA